MTNATTTVASVPKRHRYTPIRIVIRPPAGTVQPASKRLANPLPDVIMVAVLVGILVLQKWMHL